MDSRGIEHPIAPNDAIGERRPDPSLPILSLGLLAMIAASARSVVEWLDVVLAGKSARAREGSQVSLRSSIATGVGDPNSEEAA